MQRKSWVFSLVVFTCGYAHVAVAQEITVMISGGFSAALDKLAPDYQQKSGNTLHIIHGPSMGKSAEAIPNRLAAGQKADVVIMVGYALDDLQKQGKVMPGSRIELADSRIGAVVPKGAPVPDISSVAALKQTVLQAKSIAYSDSASGRYVEKELFSKLDIAAQASPKAKMIEKIPVASLVAKGDYAIGFQQVSELLPVSGVTFVGRLPDEVQYVTRFAGAVVADSSAQSQAKQLLCYLASVPAQAEIRRTGMDPLPSNACELPEEG